MVSNGTLADTYAKMETGRQAALDRAQLAASVTIPHVMPPDGHNEHSKLKDPYHGLGARAVNTLAAKIMIALLPPNTPFFRTGFDEITARSFEDDDEGRASAEENLALYDTLVSSELEATALRSIGSLAFKHLIIAGNGVIYLGKKGNFKFYDLRKYVCLRDAEGNLVMLITKESVDIRTLDEKTRNAVINDEQTRKMEKGEAVEVDVYTLQERNQYGKYVVRQEINKEVVPGSEGVFQQDAPPFIALRWTALHDENYGRGMVSEYYGDFKALNDLARDLLDASAAAAKVIFFRNPNATVSRRKLAEAKSLDILDGRAEDVNTMSIDKMHDFQVVLERIRDIKSELTEAFLMHKSVQRNAERVTAEEIRFMAQDLEDALGGVYSLLAEEFQRPLLRRFMKVVGDRGVVPQLPKDGIKLTITTGIDALGRGHEIQRIEGMLGQAGRLLGPEQLAAWIDVPDLMRVLGAGWGVPKSTFIKTAEQFQADQQQNAMTQAAQQAVPGMAQEITKQGISE